MPYFVFCSHDKPGTSDARSRVRERHRAYIRIARDGCRCVAGGPLMDDAGAAMIGSLLVFEAQDRAAVEKFVAGDPYTKENIFSSTDIWRWNWGLGLPVTAGQAT